MMRFPARRMWLSAVLALGAPLARAQCPTVVLDGDFANWSSTVYTTFGGGSMSVVPSGGNPGAYLSAAVSAYNLFGVETTLFLTKTDLTWDPAVDGPINTVSLQIDHVNLPGSYQFFSVLVVQNGQNYTASPSAPGLSATSWTTASFGPFGSTSFFTSPPSGPGQPDFSPAGAPIQFGFAVTIYGIGSPFGGGGFSQSVRAYDNWQLTVSPGPAASVTTLGPGCGATSPALSSTSPAIGSTATISLSGGSPNTPGALFAGPLLSPPLSLGASCDVFLDPAVLVSPLATGAAGTWSAPLFIPPVGALCGQTAVLQGALFPTAGPLGFDLTGGVLLRVGS